MLLESALLTAAATGALGSAHCAAMCGPLVVAGCSSAKGLSTRDSVEYFLGRIFSYATVGAVLGHLGRHALCILPMSVVEGIAVGLVAIAAAYRGITLLRGKEPTPRLVTLGARPSRPSMATLIGQLLPKRGLGLGLMTGILPCGLLLPAWALAAGTASAPAGAAVMVVFSLVTLPGCWCRSSDDGCCNGCSSRLPRRPTAWPGARWPCGWRRGRSWWRAAPATERRSRPGLLLT
jgi:sulfite exporter TauE/SafE